MPFFPLKKHSIAQLFLWLFPSLLFSQAGTLVSEKSLDFSVPFTVSRIGINEPLLRSKINCFTYKSNSNLLLETDYGVVEFDGNSFTTLSTADVFSKWYFEKMFWVERSGRLYGQTLVHGFFQLYPKLVNFPNIKASCIVNDSIYGIDSLGTIYASPVDHVKFIRRLSSGVRLPTALYYNDSRFYIGSKAMLSILKENGRSEGTIKTGYIGTFDFQKLEPSGELFAVGSYKVYRIRGSKAELFFDVGTVVPKSQEAYVQVHGFHKTGPNTYMVVLTNGIVLMDGSGTRFYSDGAIIPSDYIETSCYSVIDDCYFLGTRDQGLLKLQFKNCFSLSDGIASPASMGSIVRTVSNEILSLEKQGVVYRCEAGEMKPYFNIDGAGASLAEVDGNLFVGTWNEGLYVVKDKKIIKHLSDSLELPNNSILSVLKSKSGTIWVGTYMGVSKGTSVETIRPWLPARIKGKIACIYELRDGSVCLSADKEVFIADRHGNLKAHLGAKNGLEKGACAFYEDSGGRLWIGTNKMGLFCLDKNVLTSINKMKGCYLQPEFFCIVPDGSGYLYMSSNMGLWRIRESDLLDFYAKKRDYLIPFYYGQEAGISNTEFNAGFQNSSLSTDTGTLMFPSQKGLVIVKPERIALKTLTPSIYRIFVNDSIYNSNEFKFAPGTYSVKFAYTSELSHPKYNVYYQYKLASGSETVLNWSLLRKEKSVEFKLLPPGEYVLSVRAWSAFNEKDPVVSEIAFEILPAFHQTLLFRILIILAFAAVIFWFVKMRIDFHRRIAEKKEMHKLKTLELELRAIHAELNPHFVFNSINCIKYFVMEKNYRKANNGLIKLSRLIRVSVEDAGKLFVPLDKELKTIENYIELEKMRLKDKIEYEIVIGDGVDTSREVPHLIIQPFVENAIKHGISHLLDRTGVLKVDFQMKSETLVCTIVDNGIGREASQVINKKSKFHSSKGILLSREKINLLNAYYNYDCTCELIDLFDEGKACGTMVVIGMPLKDNLEGVKPIPLL